MVRAMRTAVSAWLSRITIRANVGISTSIGIASECSPLTTICHIVTLVLHAERRDGTLWLGMQIERIEHVKAATVGTRA